MKKLWLLLLLTPSIVLASDITSTSEIKLGNEVINKRIIDNNELSFNTVNKNNSITISNNEDIYGLYIIYERASQTGTLVSYDKTMAVGSNSFLHEYIDIEKNIGISKNLTLTYDEDVKIAEIYVLGEGELPDFVEVWEPPCKQADLLLFSTHSDDEQLFFLGLLPTYVAKGAEVEVVYYTNHYDNTKRLHEQLHGLYTVGIRHYPIIGIIPDAYSENLNWAINNLKNAGLTVDDATKFQVEMLRRFKPQVVVGHDENGEYSHGQHILNTYTLKDALEKAFDPTYDSETLSKYGIWNTPKTYLHLYKENQIIMDYDTPLSYFNGKTAYEVSKEGYSKHLSQQYTWFTKWLKGNNNQFTKATDIKTYSPCEFGLYRSTVGEDINKNDMFENLKLLKEIEQEKELELEREKEKDKEKQKELEMLNKKENNNNNNSFSKYLIYIIPSSVILIGIIIYIILKVKK